VIKSGSLDEVERVFGNAVLTISGCIRGLFTAAPGHDFICSDYSSIEAVVTAMLAGEQWRIEAFKRKEDIYLVSAGRITGRTLEEYTQYKEEHGDKHPDRQKIGKPAELGLGFGGWLMAWRQFDKSDNFSDEEVKKNIIAWRDASPAIVEMWGGQARGKPWSPERFELFGLEGAAISAVQNPGQCFSYGLITYGVKDDVLYCRLPSGRSLTYHKPRLAPIVKWDVNYLELTYEGWNSNPKMGAIGWIRIQTYGGRLMENVVQAVARDIMAHAVNNCEKAGYPIVLRVHDELVAELPEGVGSVEEFESIMATLPDWAKDWPIRAAGGWRGSRYRKD
jgi:DNA polymerase